MAKKRNEVFASRSDITTETVPAHANLNIDVPLFEWTRSNDFAQRRLYLIGGIYPADEEEVYYYSSTAMGIVEKILSYNRIDKDLPINQRIPVILYINSPGGDLTEGFSLISTIKLSKTPIYTVNIGQWSSMSFLIGITGHKRYSLPYMTFLMHDGSQFAVGSTNKVKDQLEFSVDFEEKVVKSHVLEHSKMKESSYDEMARKELYMLPEEAKKWGFIDKIVDDLDDIL